LKVKVPPVLVLEFSLKIIFIAIQRQLPSLNITT
jgi:hypothetical protein